MLSVPQMLWLVKHARQGDARVLLVGDSAQHRSVERGDAMRVLEQRSSLVIFAGPVRTQSDRLLLLLLPTRMIGRKSFRINMVHGEGIEPPTYWV